MGNTSSNIPAHSPSERERMSPPQPQQPQQPQSEHRRQTTTGGKRRTTTSPTKMSESESAEKITAKEYKERGNKLYQAQRYEDAITNYTAAIMRDNTDATYFTKYVLYIYTYTVDI